MGKTQRQKSQEKTDLIAFKVSKEIIEVLKKYGKTQKDSLGLELSEHTAARKLMLEALKNIK